MRSFHTAVAAYVDARLIMIMIIIHMCVYNIILKKFIIIQLVQHDNEDAHQVAATAAKIITIIIKFKKKRAKRKENKKKYTHTHTNEWEDTNRSGNTNNTSIHVQRERMQCFMRRFVAMIRMCVK